MFSKYDVIVVGGGHAGCEAAAAAANMGVQVLLITMNLSTIGQMSCNPAMGGIAKGQILREIDALGGMSGIVTDHSMIQFRMLNKSKGPAMWSPRTQNDRMQFSAIWRSTLEKLPNIDFWQDMVKELLVENNQVIGVKTNMDIVIHSKAVILTNGTFLNGLIHVGKKQFGGGRSGERAATGLTEQLIQLGFQSGRMKTGTPPRLDGRTLDYHKMEEQFGDEHIGKFSYLDNTLPVNLKQKSCFITYTNPTVHSYLQEGFAESPMLNGQIKGVGPRYCPSIEDKIERFVDKTRHQLFIEPEGWDTVEIYVNGFSTSLPEAVQYKALKAIVGFENVKMFRPGYAIEYDYFPPTQLKQTLETRLIENLYFAGQINGTTGYEEAACQGLMAGINAVQKQHKKIPFILSRSEAYIGVLIDDLVHKGTDEPYRMFTSRAEFRILLRQDNADLRLTEKGYKLGLASEERMQKVIKKQKDIDQLFQILKNWKITPEVSKNVLKGLDTAPLKEVQSMDQLLKRPEITMEFLQKYVPYHQAVRQYTLEVREQVAIQIKYASYIQKEKDMVEKMLRLENCSIPINFNYQQIKALSNEGREKLQNIQPTTLGQASRISGVSSSDISILMIYMGR